MTHAISFTNTIPTWEKPNKADYITDTVQFIAGAKKMISNLLIENKGNYTFDNFWKEIDGISDAQHKFTNPFFHLVAVMNDEELDAIEEEILPLWSDYSAWHNQHTELYEAIKFIYDNDDSMDDTQRRAVQKGIESFERNGIALPEETQKQIADTSKQLSLLHTDYSKNVLKSQDQWCYYANEVELEGVSDEAKQNFRAAALKDDKEGYKITIKYPHYLPILEQCDNRELRELVTRARSATASDLLTSPTDAFEDGAFDNTENLLKIISLSQQKAKLLGFDSKAVLSLETKMAESPAAVIQKFSELGDKVIDKARDEWASLQSFAKAICELDEIEPWDTVYVEEKYRQSKFNVDEQLIRQYFPADYTIPKVFGLLTDIYSVMFEENTKIETYHPDVKFYNILQDGNIISGVVLDLYSRQGKQGGAWMDECVMRYQTANGLQQPVAYVCCNFDPATDTVPSLLSISDVETILHEMGHALHHCLSTIDVMDLAGINGVPWDGVEIPSQMNEFFLYDRDVLKSLSSHYKTKDPISNTLLDNIAESNQYGQAMMYSVRVRQSLVDMMIYNSPWLENDVGTYYELWNVLHAKYGVGKIFEDSRFLHSFTHIFAGGYSAGYYSYIWSELYSADIYTAFRDTDRAYFEIGQDYKRHLLSLGGSKDMNEMFEKFRGRPLSEDSLLELRGIK